MQGTLPSQMACSVLQEMANSVYLVMEVSSHGARASTGPRGMGRGIGVDGYKHALLTFLAGILGYLYWTRSKEQILG